MLIGAGFFTFIAVAKKVGDLKIPIRVDGFQHSFILKPSHSDNFDMAFNGGESWST